MAISMRVKTQLMEVDRMRVKFLRREKVVDEELRNSFPSPPTLDKLSAAARDVFESAKNLEASNANWRPLTSPSPFISMSIVDDPANPRRIATGHARGIVDCPMMTAVAWWFTVNSREAARLSVAEGDPARVIATTFNEHDQVSDAVREAQSKAARASLNCYLPCSLRTPLCSHRVWQIIALVKGMPFPLSYREFVFRQVAVTTQEGGVCIAGWPVEREVKVDYGGVLRVVRGVAKAFVRFSVVDSRQCEIKYYQVSEVETRAS